MRDPRGLDVIEALAPLHSRYKVATKEDYFTMLRAEMQLKNWIRSRLYDTLDQRMKDWLNDKPST